eukprot:COSAG02_NODE_498_length_21087_cov_33.272394_14_plen_566_part_00
MAAAAAAAAGFGCSLARNGRKEGQVNSSSSGRAVEPAAMVGHVASSDDGMEFAEEARRFEAWLTHNGLTETAACLGRELARRDAGQRTVGSSSASAVASGADSALRRPSAAEGRLDSLLSRFARARQKRPGNSQATAPGVEAAAAAASAAANKAADVSAHAAAVREQVTAALHLEAADALAADQMFTAELVAARRPWQSPSDSVPDSYEGATDEWELADVGYREEIAERLLIWSRQAEPDGAAPVPALDSGAVESMDLRIIYRPQHTGFEPHQEFPIVPGDLVAGRYTVLDTLGTASFCTAVHALQTDTGTNVCLKIIKNSKDNFDQALDEVKLLKLVNSKQNADASHILRLFDYFYFKEHMFLVTELGGANLFDHSNCMLQEGHRAWWTIERLQRVAYQITDALVYIHSLSLIHSDLKPENIVIKSLSPLHIRVIDFGSSCFIHDDLGVYVQSRSYRAPEVIIAAPYDYRIDNWSLGTILAELATGTVLFENENVPTMLARMAAILGPFHNHAGFLATGKETHKYFTNTMGMSHFASQYLPARIYRMTPCLMYLRLSPQMSTCV